MKTDDAKGSAIGLVLDIIQTQMDLSDDRVLIYNQKWNLPPDAGLHVTAQFLGAEPFSNRGTTENRGDDPDTGGLWEVQDANFREMYQIKVMSRNNEALFRKHLVLMALASNFSQQVQEENSFRIATISTGFNDISEIEGAGILYVYAITISVHAWYHTERKIDYYDNFPGEVWTETKTEDDAIPFNVPPL